MRYFELVIPNTTPANFANDLASDVANLPPTNITIGNEPHFESVEIDEKNSQIIPPSATYPHYRLEIHAFTFRVSKESATFPQGRLILGHGRPLGAVIRAEMREMTATQIRFLGTCEDYMAGYMAFWLGQAIEVYNARAVSPLGVTLAEIVQPAEGSSRQPKWLSRKLSTEAQKSVQEVIEVIRNWIPKQNFKSEESYEAALAEYLVGQGIEAPEQQGYSLVDILAHHEIAIEVKLNPGRDDYDRLTGQIVRQLEEFGTVIVLIARPSRRDLLEEYKSRFDERVIFISK